MSAQVRMSASNEETQRSMWGAIRDMGLQGNSHQVSYSYSDSSDHSQHTAPPPDVVQIPTQLIPVEVVQPAIIDREVVQIPTQTITDQAPHPTPIIVQQPAPYPVPGEAVIVRPEVVNPVVIEVPQYVGDWQ